MPRKPRTKYRIYYPTTRDGKKVRLLVGYIWAYSEAQAVSGFLKGFGQAAMPEARQMAFLADSLQAEVAI